MEITYDYYRIFYYVAKYKGFSQAAHVLMSNQPNITKFMNNLEAQLGCTLFVRSHRGVTLTPEGEKLYAHVSIAYEHLKAAELELANDKSLQSGIVTIGVSETALHNILLPILGKFRNTYPGIRLCLYNHSTPQAMATLKNGLVDFVIVTSPTHAKHNLKETCLKEFQEILIGSNQYAFLTKEPISLALLTQYPLICLGNETATYDFYTKLFLQHGLILKPDTKAATADQLLPMVKNNLGIGFIPEGFAKKALEDHEVISIPLKDKIPKRSICLVEDVSQPLSIAANTLKEMILSEIGKI